LHDSNILFFSKTVCSQQTSHSEAFSTKTVLSLAQNRKFGHRTYVVLLSWNAGIVAIVFVPVDYCSFESKSWKKWEEITADSLQTTSPIWWEWQTSKTKNWTLGTKHSDKYVTGHS